MGILKRIFCLIIILHIVFLLNIFMSNKYVVFASEETYIEDFVAGSYSHILFDDGYEIVEGYLIEGVTESYILYDSENDELLYYCSNSHSPWSQYIGNLFSEYGLYYSNVSGYCIVNLEVNGQYDYGDIINIEEDMEIFIENNTNLANTLVAMKSLPINFEFNDLFSISDIVEDVEISNSYYFKHLNDNLPANLNNTCSLISLAMLLGYYDTFYDDDLIEDQYITKEKVYNHITSNAVSSPGAELYYEYLLNDKIKETVEYNTYNFSDDMPWYEQYNGGLDINIDLMVSQLVDIMKSDEESVLYQHFTFHRFDNSMLNDGSSTLFKSFEEIISLGYPVVAGICGAVDENNNKYYVDYITADGEWKEMTDEYGNIYGHEFVCYGYLKVIDEIVNNEEKIITYYKGHAGQKNEDGTYVYTQSLFSTRYICSEYGGDGVSGYTFIPKNNYHKCSKNYIYVNGNCSFGICPCESKLNRNEFYEKYCNVICEFGYNKYYCKEHNNHLLFSEVHTHKNIIVYDTVNHSIQCSINGCNNNLTMKHNLVHENIDGYHYEKCTDCSYLVRCIPNTYIELLAEVHSFYCQTCNKNIYESHELKYESIDSEWHRRYCDMCGFSEIVPHNSYDSELVEEILSDGTKIEYCTHCDY